MLFVIIIHNLRISLVYCTIPLLFGLLQFCETLARYRFRKIERTRRAEAGVSCEKLTHKSRYPGSDEGEWRNWYTRTTQNRVPQGLWVQVPPRPPRID